MKGPLNLNIGSSVVKREAKDIDDVAAFFERRGWDRTGSIAGGRVQYFEQDGFNITLFGGPLGTLITPSGPIRGTIFGDEAVSINQVSSIGAGAAIDKSKEEPNIERRASEHT